MKTITKLQLISFLVAITISNQSYGQDTIGEYFHINKLKTGQSFASNLIFRNDSTFQYTFKGDLFNDFAEGTYSKNGNRLRLKYKTPDYSIVKPEYNDSAKSQILSQDLRETQFKLKNPVAHLWPVELIEKRRRLIVIQTNENCSNSNRKVIYTKRK